MSKPKKKNKRRRKSFFKYFFFSKKNIFTFFWCWLKSLFYHGSIYKSPGSHLISGYPGSGKTLLANQIIQSINHDKYFVLSNIKEFNGVKSFNLEEIFQGGAQVKRFPLVDEKGRELYAIIFDEINLSFNRRMNRTTSYNELFIGLIEFLVSHRHQGVPRVYFIGQKLELQDTQLQSLFKYQHDIIQTKRRAKYWYYKMFSYVKIPTKINIVNRVKSLDDEFIELNLDKVKINRNSLLTYNTLALKENYDKLNVVNLNN